MKIVIAPDSFKESASSRLVADCIEKGVKKVFDDAVILKVQVADGGEGTVDALLCGAGGKKYTANVTGPTGTKVDAVYGILNDSTCVIEMAEASGLALVESGKRNPLLTTTYGVGQLILEALNKGSKKILIGLGGSSTNDGGVGMAQALGVSFKNENGDEIGYGGGALGQIRTIDISGIDIRLKDVEIIIVSDVVNPLCGEKGASAVFGPQKGATSEMVKELDSNLSHLSKTVCRQLGKDIANNPGSGAAGGLGYALMTFCGAVFANGIETVLDTISFDEKLNGCDLVITGEGKIDGQSIYGKVPVGIANRAKKSGIPVIALVGGIGDGAEETYKYGIDSIMSIVNRPMSLDNAILNSCVLLEEAAERAMRLIRINIT